MDVERALAPTLHQRSTLKVLDLRPYHAQRPIGAPRHMAQTDGVTCIVIWLDKDLSQIVSVILGAVLTVDLDAAASHDPAEENGYELVFDGDVTSCVDVEGRYAL